MEPPSAMQDESSHPAVDDNSETAANTPKALHLSGPRKWVLVCLLLAVTFLTRTERSLISTIYPTLAEEHRLTPEEIGWVFAVLDFSSLLSCLLWGKVLAGGWVTIKAVYMMALLGTSSSSTAFGLLYFIHDKCSFLALGITVRILMGFFSGAIFVSEAELIIKILSPDRISHLLAGIEMADSWGFLAGPFVGAVLYQMTGTFYTPFVIMSLLILAVGLTICGLLPTTKSIAQAKAAGSGEVVGIWRLLRVPLFFACLMAMFFVFMIFAQGGTFNTLYLTTIYHLTPMQASGVYIGSDLSYTVFTMATGWVIGWQRGWEATLIVASYAVLSVLCTLLGPAPYYTLIPDPLTLWLFIVIYLAISGVAGVAISAAMTLGYHTIESAGVGGSSSMTVALIRSTGFLAFGIGSTLGGTVYARLGWAWMFTVMGYVTAANTVLFVLVLYWDRRRRASVASQGEATTLNKFF